MNAVNSLKNGRGFPYRVEIELSNACNLRCIYCPRKHMNDTNGFMKLNLFKRLINELSAYPDTILVLHRRGESLLHPDFVELCGYVAGKFEEVQLATNGTVLDDEKSKAIIEAIDFVSFSIDLPDVFNHTRIPANYDEVESRILRFLDMNNGKVRTQVSMVKTVETAPENPEIFKSIWNDKVDRIRIYEEHSHDGRFGSLRQNRGKRMPCVMPFYETLVYFDGKVGRCNHDWGGEPIGDANIATLKDIWHSERYIKLRKEQETLYIKDKVCSECDSWYSEVGKQGTGEVLEKK